VIFVRIWS